VEQDIDAAMTFVDTRSLASQLPDPIGQNEAAVVRWSRRFFVGSLVQPHSLIEQAGHYSPSEEGYGGLPESVPAEGRFGTMQPLAFDPGPLESSVVPVATMGTGDSSYVFALRFPHSPHDISVFVIAQRGQKWQIVRMFWLVGC